jgi:hypothetical protein
LIPIYGWKDSLDKIPIISFDKDFDRTQLGKKIPQDIYQESEEEGVGEKDEEDEGDDETVPGSF